MTRSEKLLVIVALALVAYVLALLVLAVLFTRTDSRPGHAPGVVYVL